MKVADDAVKEKRPLVLHNCSVVLDGYLGKKWRCTSAWGELHDVPTLCTVNINSGPTLCARCPQVSTIFHNGIKVTFRNYWRKLVFTLVLSVYLFIL